MLEVFLQDKAQTDEASVEQKQEWVGKQARHIRPPPQPGSGTSCFSSSLRVTFLLSLPIQEQTALDLRVPTHISHLHDCGVPEPSNGGGGGRRGAKRQLSANCPGTF